MTNEELAIDSLIFGRRLSASARQQSRRLKQKLRTCSIDDIYSINLDRKGLRDDAESKSWNASHPSRGAEGGCSQNDLFSTGGNGLFYCFAEN